MSSFICKYCGKEIIDTPTGYTTECEHYPIEPEEFTKTRLTGDLVASTACEKAKIATHEISACYYPDKGEVEFTWRDLETREQAVYSGPVTPEQGIRISEVVSCCVYHKAVVRSS